MKKITITVTETSVYELIAEVPDDWPDTWTNVEANDVELGDHIEHLWIKKGNKAKNFVELAKRVVDFEAL